MAKIKATRRYYLHRKLKGLYVVNARKKTVEVPFGECISPKLLHVIAELRDQAGYNI